MQPVDQSNLVNNETFESCDTVKSVLNNDNLKLELKKLVIQTLKIPDIKPEEIDDDENLFEGKLGIDSVDALELVMALQRTYKVHIDDQNLGRFIIKSINTIADFIVKEQEKMKNQK